MSCELQPGPRCVALIQGFETCARKRADGFYEAYPDPGTGSAPWTIGWGSTGPDIVPGTIWTRAQCDQRFASDLARFASEVRAVLGAAQTSQVQFDALVSFAYNVKGWRDSTLLRLHCKGDHAGAAVWFERYVFAAGKRLNGLVRRRAQEAALYRS